MTLMAYSLMRSSLGTLERACRRTRLLGVVSVRHIMLSFMTSPSRPQIISSAHVPQEIRNAIRRSWSHGEISQLAEHVVERAIALGRSSDTPLRGQLEKLGPLLDIAAQDANLAEGLRVFNLMQEQRYAADYDHEQRFAKLHLVEACTNARLARMRLRAAANAAREALFTLLTVRRPDFRQR